MLADYTSKLLLEVSRLEANGRPYWYGFDLSKQQVDIIKRNFPLNTIEISACAACGGNKYDVIINLEKRNDG